MTNFDRLPAGLRVGLAIIAHRSFGSRVSGDGSKLCPVIAVALMCGSCAHRAGDSRPQASG